jgi:hypothetical protein
MLLLLESLAPVFLLLLDPQEIAVTINRHHCRHGGARAASYRAIHLINNDYLMVSLLHLSFS